MTNAESRVRTVILTAPERMDQEWIGRLAASSEIELLERVALVNQAGEMALLLKTARAYEANLVALNAARQMYSRALELGKRA